MVTDEQKAFVSYLTRLQVFLYILQRDYVPFGTLELIMRDQVDPIVGIANFSDPNQAKYAEDLADRILRGGTRQ